MVLETSPLAVDALFANLIEATLIIKQAKQLMY